MSEKSVNARHTGWRGWRPLSLRLGGPPSRFRLANILPKTLPGFVWKVGATQQSWLLCLSLTVAVLDAVPLEIQRRIVNQTIKQGDLNLIAVLAIVYILVATAQGLIKLLTNVFRSYVSETAVLELRTFISQANHAQGDSTYRGIEISLLIAESEAIGGFAGDAVAEPALQLGILASVMGYLVYIQPSMALIMLGVIIPQLFFVPWMQFAINRRVQERIVALRATSASVLSPDNPQDVAALQQQQFSSVFGLNMGVFELKFSMNFLMNFMHQLSVATILGLGGWLVVLGKTDTGTLVAFISGLATIRSPWGDLVNWFQAFSVTTAKYALVLASMSDTADE